MYEFNKKGNGNANKTLELSIRLYSKSKKWWGCKQEEQCTTMTFMKASDWKTLNTEVKKAWTQILIVIIMKMA